MTDSTNHNSGVSDETSVDRSLADADTRTMLETLEQDPFLDLEMTPAEMRAAFDLFYAKIGYPVLEVGEVEDRKVSGKGGPLAVRIYRPPSPAEEPSPVLVFFHGGGMMMGSLDAYDGLCRRLCGASGCIVVSGSYRLAPENKFPAAVEDALAIFRWVRDNAASLGGDPERLAIGGESGGGNLAAVVTQVLRDEGDHSIAFQLLINPAVGLYGTSKSIEKYARGYFFEPEVLDWFYSQYLEDMDKASDPMVSPVLAKSFEGLPPAFIIVAGLDILRDDIELYARFMKEAGVPVESSVYEGTIHGFTVMAAVIDAGRKAIDECAAKLRRALKAPSAS